MRHAALSAALAVALLPLLACQQECPECILGPEKRARLEAAEADLASASENVRKAVLGTCDRWQHRDHPCVDAEVRVDQLECWLAVGRPEFDRMVSQRVRQRARDRQTLRLQNMCVAGHRWKRIDRSEPF